MRKIITAIIISALALSAGCGNDKANGNGADKILPIETGAVRQVDWIDEVSAYGAVKYPDKVDIVSTVPGKVIRLPLSEGAAITKDQVAAVLERDEVGLTFKPVEVKATVNGIVDAIHFKEGAKVMPMTPILTIAKAGDLKLLLAVFETDLARVRLNQTAIVTIDAIPDHPLSAYVSLIKPSLDAQTGKGEVELTVPEYHPGVKPGMFARARITISRRNILTIPAEALRKIEGRHFAYVLVGDRVRLTPIEIGVQRTDIVEVVKGLNAGDIIVRFASEELKDGSRIRVTEGK